MLLIECSIIKDVADKSSVNDKAGCNSPNIVDLAVPYLYVIQFYFYILKFQKSEEGRAHRVGA